MLSPCVRLGLASLRVGNCAKLDFQRIQGAEKLQYIEYQSYKTVDTAAGRCGCQGVSP
jgi:hypothetical protein